jgi:HAE1 family hydrophobic/amphiphilic exporter-1
MDIVKAAIEKPVAVLVGVILVVLFGMISLYGLPYQLTPNVTQPEITVTTTWTGASPKEIERDIVEEQEDVLKGVANLTEMESSSYSSRAELTLTFKIGTDIDSALLRVSNKLDEVPDYPDGVDRPVISASGASASPVIWMILKQREGSDVNVQHQLTFFEDEVRQYLERVDGVADLFIGGGQENEMQVIVDPRKMAAYNLTTAKLISVLNNENISVSAGSLGVGRRDFRIRTPADLDTPEKIADTVISSSGQFRVRIRDVGEVRMGHEKPTVAMMYNGDPGIVVGVKPEPGTNVLDMTDEVNKVVRELNEGVLKDHGVYLDWTYDQRPYINGAIDLVQQNILIGGLLAVVVLFVFLQSMSATVIVAVSIPISIIGAFIIFGAAGRSLNVVSMAGISFAVGMLVDNAIVVLENIDRHRNMGKGPFEAAYDGASEVWGAVLASTLTTVAVFLPVVFMEQEAGQLFKDIAIAVTCAIFLSLFVSVLVIPMMARFFYSFAARRRKPDAGSGEAPPGKDGQAASQASDPYRCTHFRLAHGTAEALSSGLEDAGGDHCHPDLGFGAAGAGVFSQDGISAAGQPQPGAEHNGSATGTFL